MKAISTYVSRAFLVMAMAAAGAGASAQSENGSGLRGAQAPTASAQSVQTQLSGASFTGYCTYLTNGNRDILRCNDSRINPNARVFAELSEFDARGPVYGRFLGAARMTVHNVAPGWGYVDVWTDVEWGSALNVRMDLLIDP